jgi:hypothetical protein
MQAPKTSGKPATELGPDNPLAANHIGWTLRFVDRYREAWKEYERAAARIQKRESTRTARSDPAVRDETPSAASRLFTVRQHVVILWFRFPRGEKSHAPPDEEYHDAGF